MVSSSFRVGAAPEAMRGKALVGRSGKDTGAYPFSQPQGQFWVTTDCQCQKKNKPGIKQDKCEQEGRKVNG